MFLYPLQKHFGWTRLGILHDHTRFANEIMAYALESNVAVPVVSKVEYGRCDTIRA